MVKVLFQENILHAMTSPPPAWTTDIRWLHAFMLCMPDSDHTIWESSDQGSNHLLSNFGETVWLLASFLCYWLTCGSYCALLLKGLISCEPFRDALLHTWVVTSYCCLLITSMQSGHSPLTFGIKKAFSPEKCCSLDSVSFSDHSL